MSTPQGARKRLPVKPSEENLRKQAKTRAKVDRVDLSDAQHKLAKEYGFDNWARLLQHVAALGDSSTAWHSDPNDNVPKAANAGDVAKVRAFLDAGNFSQHDLDLALGRVVCGMGNYSDADRWLLADLLIDHGAHPDAQYGGNYGPIIFGPCEGISYEGIKYLIDHGAEVSFAPIDTKYGKATPLSHLLGTYGRGKNDAKHKSIDLLLANGALVPSDVIPEVFAIHRGQHELLGEMLDKDRSLLGRRFRDMPYGNIALSGATLLHCAVEFGEVECVNAILSRYRSWSDADLNSKSEVIDGIGGQTPMYHAINTNGDGCFYMLQYLIQRNGRYIDMGVKATWRSYGQPQTTPLTPLEYAEKAKREIDPKWAHYRPHVEDELALLRELDRRTALHRACERNEVATVAKMLDESPQYLTPELWPPSYKAKSVEMTKLLLDRGLDPDVSSAPRRAIDLACYHALADVVDLLIERGADVTSRNRLNETPLDLLEAYEPRPIGDPDARRVREALLKAGAKHDIHTAVRSADVDEVRKMLDADPSLVHHPDPWNPLFTAARSGRLEVAKLLLERGAKVDGTNDKGNTPLWFACQSPAKAEDRLAVAKLLLDSGAEPNVICEDGTTALHFAASRGPFAMVELLLGRGAREGYADHAGKKPIDHARIYGGTYGKPQEIARIIEFFDRRTRIREACEAGDVPTVTRMLDEHPELLGPQLWPAVIFKARSLELTKLLLDRGVDPNLCSAPRKPLHLASDHGLVDIVRLLLSRGARLDVVDSENITPYELVNTYLARPSNVEEIRQILRDAGAKDTIFSCINRGDEDAALEMLAQDPSLRDAVGPIFFTPLDAAARAGAVRLVRALLDLGAPVDNPNPTDNGALWLACQSGADAAQRIAVAKLLIERGANVNRRCEEGSTPIHFAAWRGPKAMVTLLLDHGARHWIEDDKGKTPADYCRENGVAADKEAILEVLTAFHTDDVPFRDAIAAIDAGDVPELKQLLIDHPRLVTDRLKSDSSLTRGYFANPALLWFVAENPIRNRKLPPNIGEVAEAIINAGAKLDDIKYTTALVASGLVPREMKVQVPLIEMLVRRGASPNDALDSAIGEREHEAAAAALRLGAKHTLVSAAAMGELETLRRLLEEKPSEKERLRALQFAAQYGKVGSVDMLLDAGVDVNARLPRVFEPTALHEAACFGHRHVVDRMLQRGADPTIKDTQFNGTPAGWAEHAGHKELAQHIRDFMARRR